MRRPDWQAYALPLHEYLNLELLEKLTARTHFEARL